MNVLLFIGLFEIVVIAQERDGYDIVNNYSSGPSTTSSGPNTSEPSTIQMSSTTSKKTRPTKKTKTTTVMDIIYINTNY